MGGETPSEVNVRTVEVYKDPVKLAEGERIIGATVTVAMPDHWYRTWLVIAREFVPLDRTEQEKPA